MYAQAYLRIKTTLERFVLRNLTQRTSQRVKRASIVGGMHHAVDRLLGRIAHPKRSIDGTLPRSNATQRYSDWHSELIRAKNVVQVLGYQIVTRMSTQVLVGQPRTFFLIGRKLVKLLI